MNETVYDVVPYVRLAHAHTRPDRLFTIGKLFGLAAQDFRRCRMLELGCAWGDNLVPMASAYPDSTFVGIDHSGRQIEAGRKMVSEIGLSNVELRTMSILDVGPEMGTFDYIVAHGIFSWVPEDVQAALLRVCERNLAPNGIAFVSYNTLPGWNMVASVRDLMRYHGAQFGDPSEQVRQSRWILDFMSKHVRAEASAYKQVLEKEAETIRSVADAYLFHDHLEADNRAFYLHEFMARAEAQGLQYLADSAIETMFAGNLDEEMAKAIADIPSIVRQEQYMDFLNNRRFRNTLLCHRDIPLARKIDIGRIGEFYLSTYMVPDRPIEPSARAVDLPLEFVHKPSGYRITARTVAAAAALLVLAESGRPVSLDELIVKAAARLDGAEPSDVRAEIVSSGMRLALSGGFILHADAGPYTLDIAERPVADRAARYQSRTGAGVVNRRHELVTLKAYPQLMLRYLDGTRDKDELAETMLGHVMGGDLQVQSGGTAITDRAQIRSYLRTAMDDLLRGLARDALLVT